MAKLTQFEIQLSNDPSGVFRDPLLNQLIEEEKLLSKKINMISSQNERQKIFQLLTSIENAKEIIKILWSRYHSLTNNVVQNNKNISI